MIILDTHAWIWWVSESSKLSATALQTIVQATEPIGIHPISCWEVAMLVSKNRLQFNRDVGDWVELALKRPNLRLLPVSAQEAVLAARLPGDFHGDPADRFLAAACLTHEATLISTDQFIHAWGRIPVIW